MGPMGCPEVAGAGVLHLYAVREMGGSGGGVHGGVVGGIVVVTTGTQHSRAIGAIACQTQG